MPPPSMKMDLCLTRRKRRLRSHGRDWSHVRRRRGDRIRRPRGWESYITRFDGVGPLITAACRIAGFGVIPHHSRHCRRYSRPHSSAFGHGRSPRCGECQIPACRQYVKRLRPGARAKITPQTWSLQPRRATWPRTRIGISAPRSMSDGSGRRRAARYMAVRRSSLFGRPP
jgi:hypothetical protein